MTLLSDRINTELDKIEELVLKTHKLLSLIININDEIYLDGLVSGLALHLENYYMGVERIFSVIAKEIDKVMPSSESWHIQLLKQMSVTIPSIRPPVISSITYQQLNEFRGFRHVVRNLYAYDLKHQRVIELANKLNNCHENFRHDIINFRNFII